MESAKKTTSVCDVEALKKCLEETKGDYFKCQSQIEAFKSSCSHKKPTQKSLESPPNPNNNLASPWSLIKILEGIFSFYFIFYCEIFNKICDFNPIGFCIRFYWISIVLLLYIFFFNWTWWNIQSCFWSISLCWMFVMFWRGSFFSLWITVQSLLCFLLIRMYLWSLNNIHTNGVKRKNNSLLRWRKEQEKYL